MPTMSLREQLTLDAVAEYRWYPTQTIAAATVSELEDTRDVLDELDTFGLVTKMGGPASLFEGQPRWALTRTGEDVVQYANVRALLPVLGSNARAPQPADTDRAAVVA